MGRLDDMYLELQGLRPKSKKPSNFVGQKLEVRQDPSAKKNTEVKTGYEHRDLGTKKDPAKLRKQVISSRAEQDPVAAILKRPI